MTPPNPTAPSGPYAVDDATFTDGYSLNGSINVLRQYRKDKKLIAAFDVGRGVSSYKNARRHAEAFAVKLNAEHAALNTPADAAKHGDV